MGEEVVHAVPFLKGTRWHGAVEVVRLARDNGPVISLRLRIGHRFLVLPRRGIDEVIAAAVEAKEVARKLYVDLIKKRAPHDQEDRSKTNVTPDPRSVPR